MADTTLAAGAQAEMAGVGSSRCLVDVSPTEKYLVWVADSGDDPQVTKWVDSGGWSEDGDHPKEASATNCGNIAAWPDSDTRGDTGTLIHIFWIHFNRFGSPGIYYANYDTDDESLSTPVLVVAIPNSSTTLNTLGKLEADISGTKARDGDLHVVFNGGRSGTQDYFSGHYRSTDGGANWTARANPLALTGHTTTERVVQHILLPGDGADDDLCMYLKDLDLGAIRKLTYDNGDDEWSDGTLETSDDFTDSDGVALGDGTGGTHDTGTGNPWTSDAANWEIQSNRVERSGDSTGLVNAVSNASTPDVIASVEFDTGSMLSDGGFTQCGLTIRGDGDSVSDYLYCVLRSDGKSFRWVKIGTESALIVQDSSLTISDGNFRIEVMANGDELKATLYDLDNNTLVSTLSVTEDYQNTGTRHGLHYRNNQTLTTTPSFDNYRCRDITHIGFSEPSAIGGNDEARQFDAAQRHSDDAQIVAWNTHYNSASNAIKCAEVSGTTVTANDPGLTSQSGVFGMAVTVINTSSGSDKDDIFLSYLSGTIGSSVDVYAVRYDSSMTSWGSAVQFNTTAADHRAVYASGSIGDAGGKFGPAWFNDGDDEVETDFSQLVEIAAVGGGGGAAIAVLAKNHLHKLMSA